MRAEEISVSSSTDPPIITIVLHPWLYTPGWCMGLDLSWFGHSTWNRSRRCSAMAATSSRARGMLTWAAPTRRSSPALTHTEASNTASASRQRARPWVLSWPVVVPHPDTASNMSYQGCASTAVTQTCVTAPPPGAQAHYTTSVHWSASCCWGCGCDMESICRRTYRRWNNGGK